MSADRVRAAGESPVAFGLRTGRFATARVEHWLAQYAADPVGTAALIEQLHPLPEVCARLNAAAPLPADDGAEFAHLFPRPPSEEPEPAEFAQLFPAASAPEVEPDEFTHLFPPDRS